jgi:hypothetical protein
MPDDPAPDPAAEAPPRPRPQARPRFGHDPDETRRVVWGRMRVRFWRTLDYLSLFASMLVIYGAAFGSEYLLAEGLSAMLARDVGESQVVAVAFRIFKVGLALLTIFLGTVHAFRSARSQLELDRKLTGEG